MGQVNHIHSIEVTINNPDELYIATHDGLFRLMNGEVGLIGTDGSDFMGFAAHPTNQNILYSSGHNENTGGNLGLRISNDRGDSWSKLSNGIDGPVDFHSLGISSANPNILYGWHDKSVQVSSDGGATWGIGSNAIPTVFSFNPDPRDENKVTALTWQGVMKSEDRGITWVTAFDGLGKEAVTALLHKSK
ncbi:hypothetical protein CL654_02030 [bacterium]|mgnify:CR=1 FL=1|nr:hypothetical protein [bacterium]